MYVNQQTYCQLYFFILDYYFLLYFKRKKISQYKIRPMRHNNTYYHFLQILFSNYKQPHVKSSTPWNTLYTRISTPPLYQNFLPFAFGSLYSDSRKWKISRRGGFQNSFILRFQDSWVIEIPKFQDSKISKLKYFQVLEC